jgi:serine/threonine-protein kinase RsbW
METYEKLSSRLDAIPVFVSTVLNRLKALGLSREELFDTKLCLDEALINAVKHGNKFNPDLKIEVRIKVKDKTLSIEVKDQGKGFNFKEIPNPTREEHLQRNSGRGIFLIKQHMDKVKHFGCGNKIRMIKFLKTGGKR